MPQIQAINSQILKALQPEEAAQFDEALERLQARAQTLLTEAKKLDTRGLMSDQIKMLKDQLKRI
jgi:hypothetical protein